MTDPNNLSQQILFLKRDQFNVEIRKKHRDLKIMKKRLQYMHNDNPHQTKLQTLNSQQQKLDSTNYDNDFEDAIDNMDFRLSNISFLIHKFTQTNNLDMLTKTISKLNTIVFNYSTKNQKMTNMLLQKKILQNIVQFLEPKYQQHQCLELVDYVINILCYQHVDPDIHIIYENMFESVYPNLVRIWFSSQSSFQKILGIVQNAIDDQFKQIQCKVGQNEDIFQLMYDNHDNFTIEICTFIESCFQERILEQTLKKKYIYVLRRMMENKQNYFRLDEIVGSVVMVGKYEPQLILDDEYWLKKINILLVDKLSNAKLIRSCLQLVNLWFMKDQTSKIQLDNGILDVFIKLLQQTEIDKIRQQVYFNLSNILASDDYQFVKIVIQQNFTSYFEKTFENEVLNTKQEMVFCIVNIMQCDDDDILSHVVQNRYKECLGEVLINYNNYSANCVVNVINGLLIIFRNIDKRYTENIEARNKGSYNLIRECRIEEGLDQIYKYCKNEQINDKCYLLREKIDIYIPENQDDVQFF